METGDFKQSGAMAEAWRAIDASANRAGEALRTLEDVVRFMLDDAHLTRLAKDLRHDLAAALDADLRDRVFLRDVPGDVGTGVAAAAALGRRSSADVIAANAARAAQALRSLEEFVPLVAPRAAGRFEPLRYRLYSLERAAVTSLRARDRLGDVDLCVLVDGRNDLPAFERLLETLLEAGVRMIQIRDKQLDLPTLAGRTARAVALARRRQDEAAAIVVVNDRADVAAAVGADGMHGGAHDLPATLARRVIGPARLLGRTAHDLAEARAAVLDGADYLGVGPCFPSNTKAFERFAPPEFLRTVAAEISLPAFAIGGITLDRVDAVWALGIRRVAVASAITAAADPAQAAAAIIGRLRQLRSPTTDSSPPARP
jgi:thiamine-phosphate pyrophosphorylase